jgi:hypothetical protein
MIGTMAFAGFVRAYWKPVGTVLFVAIVLALVYLIGRAHANEAWERKHGQAVAEWNAERFKAADKARAAEAEARRIETAWRDHVAKREKEYRADVQIRDARIAELGRSGDRLRSAVDHFVRAGGTASDPGAACRDLRTRVETLGALVAERDAMAGTCEAEADRLGDAVRLCRGYGDALRPAQ